VELIVVSILPAFSYLVWWFIFSSYKTITMKCKTLFLVMILFFSVDSFAQKNDEALIRKLEEKEREAILKSDTSALSELMSMKIIVQNPESVIVGFQQIMERIRKGKINYASFERRIDSVSFVNGMAVVMGLEILMPQAVSQNAGKTVNRRFTNIWTRENGTWKLTVRQATIISIN
jgi:hypothetical protein